MLAAARVGFVVVAVASLSAGPVPAARVPTALAITGEGWRTPSFARQTGLA